MCLTSCTCTSPISILLSSKWPYVRPKAVARPWKAAPAGWISSTSHRNGGRYLSAWPTTSNRSRGPPAITVSPRVPVMRLRTPASGGRLPDRRRTSQTPSSSSTEAGFRSAPSAKHDGDAGAVALDVEGAAGVEPDRPLELGLEVAHLHDLAHTAAAGHPPRACVGAHDLLTLDLRGRGGREAHHQHGASPNRP